jgi:hypothetical protein
MLCWAVSAPSTKGDGNAALAQGSSWSHNKRKEPDESTASKSAQALLLAVLALHELEPGLHPCALAQQKMQIIESQISLAQAKVERAQVLVSAESLHMEMLLRNREDCAAFLDTAIATHAAAAKSLKLSHSEMAQRVAASNSSLACTVASSKLASTNQQPPSSGVSQDQRHCLAVPAYRSTNSLATSTLDLTAPLGQSALSTFAASSSGGDYAIPRTMPLREVSFNSQQGAFGAMGEMLFNSQHDASGATEGKPFDPQCGARGAASSFAQLTPAQLASLMQLSSGPDNVPMFVPRSTTST